MAQDSRRKILAGGRMRKLRQEIGLSQSAMAQELGISLSYLNLIERNQRPVTAQLLIKLSELYSIDPSAFAHEEEQRAQAELEEIFTDPIFAGSGISKTDVRDLNDQAPAIADAMKKLYRGYREARELQAGQIGLNTDTDRSEPQLNPSTDDPIERIRQFIESNGNHFPDLESAADAVTRKLNTQPHLLYAALVDYLKAVHNIAVQVVPAHVLPQALRRYDFHRRTIMISELVEPPGRTFQVAFQLALVEAHDVLEEISERFDKEQGTARKMARIMLANYFAAAVMMPYDKFLSAAESTQYDVDVLASRFSASFEQVAHRLTTLSNPSRRGIPFFMIRVDHAGNVSKRFSAGTFPFSRFGGTCPKWSIHQAFQKQGQVETQVVELPNGSRWFSIARRVRPVASSFGEAGPQFVVGLGCDIKFAERLLYAKAMDLEKNPPTPIGINCRLCERLNCAQRAAPPLIRRLEINENMRGLSPFDSGLGR